MKILKTISLSLFISLIISSGLITVQILIENSKITRTVNRHFYTSNCLSTMGYTDLVIGAELIINTIKLNKITPKEFKVEKCNVEFYRKNENSSNEFIKRQIELLRDDIIPEYLEDCSFKKEETNFINKTAYNWGECERFGMSLEEYNNFYDFRYYYIDMHKNDWYKDEYTKENYYVKV